MKTLDFLNNTNCKLCKITHHLLTFRSFPLGRLLILFPIVPSHSLGSTQFALIPLLCGMLPIPNSCSQRTEFGCRTGQHVRLPPFPPVQEAIACQIYHRLPPLLPIPPPPPCHNASLDIQAIN